jgi:hypothetical protein
MYECGTTCVMYFTRGYFLVLKYMFSFSCLDRGITQHQLLQQVILKLHGLSYHHHHH